MTTLSGILHYASLPREITDFERRYLDRMNRVGLGFFAVHVPVFVLVAWLNDTGPILAAILTSLTLFGPALAFRALDNPRIVSMVYGFTAMCMGGLLVHFGQGPLQIEMHFYFFSLLAALALYANPAVIQTAAATVTVHHLVVWMVLPSSVFNYDAAWWVVGVHAIFVVVESVAACFIARSFFDNVIGLERIVQARTQQLDQRNAAMRLVLDNVGQGFLTLDPDARMSTERSAVLARWLGPAPESQRFAEYIAAADPVAAEWFDLGWEMVVEGFMPLTVAISQLPTALEIDGRRLDVAYSPILDDAGALLKVLVVISDVTAEVGRERAEAEQHEIVSAFGHYLNDKTGFLEFFDEADQLITSICDDTHGGDLDVCKRWLHTIKGNAAIFGLTDFATAVHELEERVVEQGALPTQDDLATLRGRWERIRGNIDRLTGDRGTVTLEVPVEAYQELMHAVQAGATADQTLHTLRGWKLEPAHVRMRRIAEQARGIARRLNKPNVNIHIEAAPIRMVREAFSPFWQSFVHVVRNALDHGVEALDEREQAGKSGPGSVSFSTRLEPDALVVEVHDDGRGICWQEVRAKALDLGLPVDSDEDLVHALFVDGMTTRRHATEISGRGVGLGAVREACERLGGEVVIVAEPGRGTRVQFRFHTDAIEPLLWRAA